MTTYGEGASKRVAYSGSWFTPPCWLTALAGSNVQAQSTHYGNSKMDTLSFHQRFFYVLKFINDYVLEPTASRDYTIAKSFI